MRALVLLVMLAQFDPRFWDLREAIGPHNQFFNNAGRAAAELRERQQLEDRLDDQQRRIEQLEQQEEHDR